MSSESARPAPTKRLFSALAGHTFSIEFESEVAHLADAFANLEANVGQTATLQISVGVDRCQLDAALQLVEGGSVHQRQGDSHLWLASMPRHMQRLSMVSSKGPQTAAATVLLDRSERLDGSLRARPANQVISAWATRLGIIPIHASGIALGGRALLMLGKGGSGKTTTALALAERGWDILADDLCFLYRDGPWIKVASLYATAILTDDSLLRLHASQWEDLGITHHGKSARRLPSSINIAPEAELAGVVWVSPDEGALYQPTPLSREQALQPWQEAFAPALHANGPTSDWFHYLVTLSRCVPAWNMRLDWDLDKLDAAFRQLIAQTGSKHANAV